MAVTDDGVEPLTAALADGLVERRWRCATAESCTGGGIAKALTERAGSSEWFDRGFVTYSNEAKQAMLGVPDEVLARCGAVSTETARAMAEGALRQSRAQAAVAVTGVAGPGGGSPDKPVGTVVFAWAIRGAGTSTETLRFQGDRHEVREQAIEKAISGLLSRLPET